MTVTVANTATTNTFDYWRNRTNELADAMTRLAVTVNSNNATGNGFVNGYFGANSLSTTTLRGGNNTTTADLVIGTNVQVGTGNTLWIGNSSVNVSINSSSIYINNTGIFSLVAGNGVFGNSLSNTVLNANGIHVTNAYITLPSNTAATYINVGNNTVNVVITPFGITTSGLSVSPISSPINVSTSGTGTQLIDSWSLTTYRAAEYVLVIKNSSANQAQMQKLLVLSDGVGAGNYDAWVSEYGVIASNTNQGAYTANANATHCRVYLTPIQAATQVKGHRIFVVT